MREVKYGAIPTLWNGVQYRSRLEARTACFLASYSYHFDYEPLDLQRYVPDFLVELPFGTVLLECKPAVRPQEFRAPCRRITRSGWAGPAIVLGSQLALGPDDRPDLTMYGTLEAEEGGWSRVGRERWPAAWGEYAFEDVFRRWLSAGNAVQWAAP